MVRNVLVSLLGVVAFASSAVATPLLSYDTLDLGFKRSNFSGDSAAKHANGLEARASYSPVENFFIEGGYNYDVSSLEYATTSTHNFRYGAGAYLPFGCDDAFHAVVRVGGFHFDVNDRLHDKTENEYGSFSFSSDGVYASPELRAKVTSELELSANAEWSDIEGKGGTNWNYTVGAVYAIDTDLALNVKTSIDEYSSTTSWLVGVRMSY